MNRFSESILVSIDNATTAEGERAEIQRILGQADEAIREAAFGQARRFAGEFRGDEDASVTSHSRVQQRLVILSAKDASDECVIAGCPTNPNGG